LRRHFANLPALPSSLHGQTEREERSASNRAFVDIIDGTPLLDIKPYVPEFDCYPNSKAGWFDESNSKRRLADDRFDSTPGKGPEQR
jgi:hypothetical protein